MSADTRKDDELRAQNLERANRLSEKLVRTLLFGAIFLNAAFALAIEITLWIYTAPLTTFIVGILITAGWVMWLRLVEFDRFRDSIQPQGIQRFRRPE